MAKTRLPTIRLLRQLISYDADEGTMTWRPRPASMFPATKLRTAEHSARLWNSQWAGTPALSCIKPDGYCSGRLLGISLRRARVAYAIAHGRWPKPEVDHRNRNRSDDRIANLRAANRSSQMRNTGIFKHNRSGFKGVSWSTREQKWLAYIKVDGRQRSLGYHATVEAAASARRTAEDGLSGC